MNFTMLFLYILSLPAFLLSSDFPHLVKADDGAYISFCSSSYPTNKTLLPSGLYKDIVDSMPICCVDVFVYNTQLKKYFTVVRKEAPAKGIRWLPGGRLCKGEGFFECAQRKCLDEVGIIIEPLAILGVYSTLYPDSAWDCPTHTVNIAIFALTDQQEAYLNQDHKNGQWISIEETLGNDYLNAIYDQSKKYLLKLNQA
jgi:ADP-ribose pyrophosphatase YjhB (NUDIX family)